MTKQEQAAYWQSVSDEWQASGEPQKQFCQRRKISYGQFVTWRSKLLSKQGKSRNQLQPVRVTSASITPAGSQNTSSIASEATIQLMLPNGIKVCIAPATPVVTIKDVLACLGFIS